MTRKEEGGLFGRWYRPNPLTHIDPAGCSPAFYAVPMISALPGSHDGHQIIAPLSARELAAGDYHAAGLGVDGKCFVEGPF